MAISFSDFLFFLKFLSVSLGNETFPKSFISKICSWRSKFFTILADYNWEEGQTMKMAELLDLSIHVLRLSMNIDSLCRAPEKWRF